MKTSLRLMWLLVKIYGNQTVDEFLDSTNTHTAVCVKSLQMKRGVYSLYSM